LHTHELKNVSQLSYQSNPKPVATLAPVQITIKPNAFNSAQASTQSKAFTAQIYKKAIKSLNTKHRQIQQQHETYIHSSRHVDLASRSTSNMSIQSQSTAQYNATSKLGLIDERSDLVADDALMATKPIFSRSLAEKIANAKRTQGISKMGECVLYKDVGKEVRSRVVSEAGLHFRREKDGKKI